MAPWEILIQSLDRFYSIGHFLETFFKCLQGLTQLAVSKFQFLRCYQYNLTRNELAMTSKEKLLTLGLALLLNFFCPRLCSLKPISAHEWLRNLTQFDSFLFLLFLFSCLHSWKFINLEWKTTQIGLDSYPGGLSNCNTTIVKMLRVIMYRK